MQQLNTDGECANLLSDKDKASDGSANAAMRLFTFPDMALHRMCLPSKQTRP